MVTDCQACAAPIAWIETGTSARMTLAAETDTGGAALGVGVRRPNSIQRNTPSVKIPTAIHPHRGCRGAAAVLFTSLVSLGGHVMWIRSSKFILSGAAAVDRLLARGCIATVRAP